MFSREILCSKYSFLKTTTIHFEKELTLKSFKIFSNYSLSRKNWWMIFDKSFFKAKNYFHYFKTWFSIRIKMIGFLIMFFERIHNRKRVNEFSSNQILVFRLLSRKFFEDIYFDRNFPAFLNTIHIEVFYNLFTLGASEPHRKILREIVL